MHVLDTFSSRRAILSILAMPSIEESDGRGGSEKLSWQTSLRGSGIEYEYPNVEEDGKRMLNRTG